jgi:hypothetical protein
VWYSFTPAVSGNYTFSTCADVPIATTVDDTVMAIYSSTGPCGGLVPLAGGCDDDSCGVEDLQSVLRGISLSGGATYYVVVWQYDAPPPSAGNTAVQVHVTQALGPGNDTCDAAIPLVLDAPVAGSTVGGNHDYELPPGSACFGGGRRQPARSRRSTPSGAQGDTYSFRVTYDTTKRRLCIASDCPAGRCPHR